MVKHFFTTLLALLLLAACGVEKQPPGSKPQNSQSVLSESAPELSSAAPAPGQEASAPADIPPQLQAALDRLRDELWERGMADYSPGMEAIPYEGDISGRVNGEEEIPAEDLLVFQFFADRAVNPGNYMVAAITKDHQNFFQMSMVDGVLYDIRESPYYLHQGEHRMEEAKEELERFLALETELDPKQYEIRGEAKRVGETDQYYFTFYKKEAENQIWQDFGFYVSKDLRQITRIDYEEGPVEQYRYLETIQLRPGDEAKDRYTMEEAESLLEEWLKDARPRDQVVKKEEVTRDKVIFYRFWTLLEDGTSNLYEISSDLFFPYRFEVIKITGNVPRYTTLRE